MVYCMWDFLVVVTILAKNIFALSEYDYCKVKNSTKLGECLWAPDDCRTGQELPWPFNTPQLCGYEESRRLICCPTNKTNKPGARTRERCAEYSNIVIAAMFIPGAEPKAKSKEFPHMAAIGFGEGDNILWLCGGSLISYEFVLTAAHCVRSIHGNATWVRLGDLDLKNLTDDANPEDIAIAGIYRHPGYKPSAHYNDIALLKLSKTVYVSLYVRPACLHTRRQLQGRQLQATGWGQVDYFGERSSHLLKGDLDVVPAKECKKRFPPQRRLDRGIDDHSQICAGHVNGTDTCPGDSGGPLHFEQNMTEHVREHFVVAGITSFGKGCGGDSNSVGIYTRVSDYLTWIEDIVWPLTTALDIGNGFVML